MLSRKIPAGAGIILAVLSLPHFAFPCWAAQKAWLLEQSSQVLPGKLQTVTLSSLGLKLASKDLELIFAAPTFDALLCSSRGKVFFELSFDDCVKRFFKAQTKKPFMDELTEREYSKSGTKTGKIAGLPVKQYFVYRKGAKEDQQIFEYWATDRIVLSPRMVEIAYLASQLPPGKGIPLRVAKVYPDGTKKIYTNTTSVKQVAINLNEMKKPAGYKRVKSEMQVMFAGAGQDELMTD